MWLLLAPASVAHAQDGAAPRDSSRARLEAPSRWEKPNIGFSAASRWRMLDAYGVQVPNHPIFDPYNQNVLKGDLAIFGHNVFPVLTGVGTSNVFPTNAAGAKTDVKNKAIVALEVFHGATVFKPKDWSLKVSGQKVANRGNKDVDDLALFEAFGEVKLFDVGSTYDFTSFRAGLQPFNSDFNGFIFKDVNLAAQLIGELSQNRYRWALSYFDQRVKTKGDGASGEAKNQSIAVANWIWEDLFRPGFIALLSYHHNSDHSVGGNDVEVDYLGIASAGHWGRIELDPAFYYATGTEEANPIAGRATTVSAYFVGGQFAYSTNYLKYRAAAFVASGDSDPLDDHANGFDSINDNVNLFGGTTSFIVGNAAFFTRPNSFLPSRRLQGVSNFVNPGGLLTNLGLDAVLTPKSFLQLNYNQLQFMDTASLPVPSGEPQLSRSVAQEFNAVLNYRLFLNENLVLQVGGNVLLPQDAGKRLLKSSDAITTGNLGVVLVY